MGLHNGLRRMSCRLTLCNVDPRIYEVFAVTRLNEVPDVRPRTER
jgi:hypothetical protein